MNHHLLESVTLKSQPDAGKIIPLAFLKARLLKGQVLL